MGIFLVIFITSLFWALFFFLYLAHKNNEEIRRLHAENAKLREDIRRLEYLSKVESPSNYNEILKLRERILEKDKQIKFLSLPKTNPDKEIQRLNEILHDKDAELQRFLSVENEYIAEIRRLNDIFNGQNAEKEIRKELERLHRD